jgi:ADP-ribose pyrophosphatase YjhB (NUDIX family)
LKLLRKLTDKDFGGTNEISYANPRTDVRAVLLDENDNIALMYMPKFKRNNLNDFYVLPGGGVEASENLEGALEREILEETGCHFNILE